MGTYKILLVGEGGVGKSAYLKRVMGCDFEKRYITTIGVEVHPIVTYRDTAQICFNVWDIAGQERFGGLRDGYYRNADAAIIMYDYDRTLSLKRALFYYNDIKRVCGSIPIALVGNKSDLKEKRVQFSHVNDAFGDIFASHKYDVVNINTSAKDASDLLKPFNHLISQIKGEEISLSMNPKKNDRKQELLEQLEEIVAELKEFL